MSSEQPPPTTTSPLAWVALAVSCAAVTYAPMLLGHKSGEILLKLGLIRSVPIATALALIYSIGVALLEKKNVGRISKPIAATIVIGVIGLVLDAGAWVLAFNRHGP
jgi:hypothetical protein